MNIKQIKELLTNVTTEILGTSEIVTENLVFGVCSILAIVSEYAIPEDIT